MARTPKNGNGDNGSAEPEEPVVSAEPREEAPADIEPRAQNITASNRGNSGGPVGGRARGLSRTR